MDGTLESRLAALERGLETLTRRLDALEARAAPAQPPRRPTSTQAAPPPPADPVEPRLQPWQAPNFEELLGGRVLAWVGGLAVLLGVVFFVAIAVDRGWLGEEARVALAFVGSTILLAAGLFLYERRGQTEAAVAAVASALAALYASLTVATSVHDVVADEPGLGVAGLIGATGAAIAVRWRSQLVAALGLLGALSAPVLVSSGSSNLSLAFTIVALASTVTVLLWQRWGWLGVGAFFISAPQLAAWAWDEDRLALTLPIVGLHWALFVVAAIGYELRVPTSVLRASSGSLLLANAAFTALLGYVLIDDDASSSGGTAWILALTVCHVALGAAGFRQRMSREVAALLLAVGIGLSGVTLALALDGPALVAGWAAEAAVLAWVAQRTGDRRAYVGCALFLGAAAALTLLVEAEPDGLVEGVAELGRALVAVLAVTAAAVVAIRFVDRGEELRRWLVLVAAAGLVYAPSLAIVDVLQGDEVVRSQTAQVALSAFWSLTGLVAILAGLVRDLRLLRLAGLGLLGLAVAKVFAYDLAELDQIYRVLSFVALGLLLLAGAYAYGRARDPGRS